MASCAPILVLIRLDAHLPNAAEPPALFISATNIPSITRKIRIPIFQLLASLNTIPPLSLKNMVFIISSRLPLLYSSAPTIIPVNSDEYTSFVINASAIATTGGSNANTVA